MRFVTDPFSTDPLDVLAAKVNAAQNDCLSLQQMLAAEPLLQESNPRAVQLKQHISRTLDTDCKQTLIEEAKNLCPSERPRELAPELLIVFDASGSMIYSLTATREEIQRAENTVRQLSQLGPWGQAAGAVAGMIETDRLTQEPRRITAAKHAASDVVRQIPGDVNIGLVLIEDCDRARSVGIFAPSERGTLLSKLQMIQPVSGTPLADGIARAGEMLDGVNKESVMLVVSDGEEKLRAGPLRGGRAAGQRQTQSEDQRGGHHGHRRRQLSRARHRWQGFRGEQCERTGADDEPGRAGRARTGALPAALMISGRRLCGRPVSA